MPEMFVLRQLIGQDLEKRQQDQRSGGLQPGVTQGKDPAVRGRSVGAGQEIGTAGHLAGGLPQLPDPERVRSRAVQEKHGVVRRELKLRPVEILLGLTGHCGDLERLTEFQRPFGGGSAARAGAAEKYGAHGG